jgi:cyclic pyranopterin phosphate synthase
MIDVSEKSSTLRTARAWAKVTMKPETIQAIHEGRTPKGDPLVVARVAATQAAKNTQLLIPYCHQLPLDFVGVDFSFGENFIDVRVEVKAVWKTGVEMEAMTGAAVAALTLYDMLKIIDSDLAIQDVRLVSKTGGKSDFKQAFSEPLRAAVLILSDSIAAGTKRDTAGEAVASKLRASGIDVEEITVLPDDESLIANWLQVCADEMKMDLVLTTGGTGLGPRDVTPEATRQILDREIPGLAERLREYGSLRTPHASLSRSVAGQRRKTIIVNLPGSEKGALESLTSILPSLFHACKMVQGGDHAEPHSRIITDSE